MITTAIKIRMGRGIPLVKNRSPWPTLTKAAFSSMDRGRTSEMGVPLVMYITRPRQIPMKHMVTMKWISLILVISMPWIQPITTPEKIAITEATQGFMPPLNRTAPMAMARHMVAPTARSIPPVSITNAIAITVIPVVDMETSMVFRFSQVRNTS